tara:strand:- start:38 stop:637 length:600 start_codon:yes stop_codon:yes gene_type:complete
MGSNASTGGGGGGVGPAGLITNKKTGETKYGEVKDAKKTSGRNELRTFIRDGGIGGAIIKGITGKTPYERNLERRQKFVKKKGLTSDEINMDASYLGSKAGLKELKAQGYTTASDMGNNGSGNDNNGNQVVQAPEVKAPASIEVSQAVPEVTSEEARATANELILKKRKGRGRSLNMLQTSAQGLSNEGLTLSNKTLLG